LIYCLASVLVLLDDSLKNPSYFCVRCLFHFPIIIIAIEFNAIISLFFLFCPWNGSPSVYLRHFDFSFGNKSIFDIYFSNNCK
jgi:hypothetical protein